MYPQIILIQTNISPGFSILSAVEIVFFALKMFAAKIKKKPKA